MMFGLAAPGMVTRDRPPWYGNRRFQEGAPWKIWQETHSASSTGYLLGQKIMLVWVDGSVPSCDKSAGKQFRATKLWPGRNRFVRAGPPVAARPLPNVCLSA